MIPIRDRLPHRRVPVVNYLLIALNVLVFMWERAEIALGDRRLLFEWGLVPRLVVRHPAEYGVNILTSMFMHDPTGWLHIGGNMLFLWIFGDNVEDALGRGRYLGFYLLSGLAAAGAQILIDPASPVPMVGASGAIAGVLAAYMSLYPRAPITVLNPIPVLWLFWGLFLELPAWIVDPGVLPREPVERARQRGRRPWTARRGRVLRAHRRLHRRADPGAVLPPRRAAARP